MSSTVLPFLLFLLIGLIAGFGLGWLVARWRLLSGAVGRAELEAGYVAKPVFVQLQETADVQQQNLQEKELEIRELERTLAAQRQQLQQQVELMAQHEARARKEFELLANRVLEEKTQKFTVQNQAQLDQILAPLRDKIKSFEQGIQQRFVEETRDRVSLKKEIEQLRSLNQQLSEDANNLAAALKGDNKTQGDWGEFQLELLLEKAGLTKGIHYIAQPSFSDANGHQKRPDFIINLPEGKQLILDAKVSLKAYDRLCQADRKEDRQRHLKAHLASLRQHTKILASKRYEQLYQINTPDYLLLFVPIEPALVVAVQEDSQLFSDALEQNIVIVSTSTLLATLRTVSFIWKQERQKRNVLEIARQSGLLYDKFCGFVEDLQQIGQRLEQTQQAYGAAMNKLVRSPKRGDTLVGRAERIRELGARTRKRLPKHLAEQSMSGLLGEEE